MIHRTDVSGRIVVILLSALILQLAASGPPCPQITAGITDHCEDFAHSGLFVAQERIDRILDN